MKRTVFVVVMVSLLCGVGPMLLAQGKFELKLEEIEDEEHPLLTAAREFMRPVPERPPGLKGLPKALSKTILYLEVPICGKVIQFVLDSGAEPPRIYVDTNADGDLSDEKASMGKREKEGPGVTFEPIEVTVPRDGEKVKVTLGIEGYLLKPDGGFLLVGSRTVRTGEIKVGGKSIAVALADSDLNGRYDDFLGGPDPDIRKSMSGDNIAIDWNGNGEFDSDYGSFLGEVRPLSRMMKIGKTYYDVRPAADGSTIEIKIAQPKLGTLDVQCAAMGMIVWSDTGIYDLDASDGGWQLPSGSYRAMQIRLTKKDKKGSEWALSCYGWSDGGKLTEFEVKEGETTTIKAGPPLTVQTEATVEEEEISIGVSISGRAGEMYGAGASKDGERQATPSFRILDRSKKELASGSFKHG